MTLNVFKMSDHYDTFFCKQICHINRSFEIKFVDKILKCYKYLICMQNILHHFFVL